MSSPRLTAPPAVRWLSVLVVVAAAIVRFWPHAATIPAPEASPGTIRAAAVATAPASPPAAHRTVGFRTPERLFEHFRKHGAEFHAASSEDYLRMAQALRDRPADRNVLEHVRADGVVSRFDRVSGAFLAYDADGTLRTFFRPSDGERYFERQAARPPGRP